MYAVVNDSNRTELSTDATLEKSDGDKLVDGMDFGELCDEFECISSPSVEATARQLVRDILELREGNRALGTFAVSVKYKVGHRLFIYYSLALLVHFLISRILMLNLVLATSLDNWMVLAY